MRPIIVDLVHLIKRHWVKLTLIGAVAVWMLVLAWPRSADWPSSSRSAGSIGELEVVFCDAGQGDAILIQQGFRQIMVDGGPNQQALECFERQLPFFDREIDVVVVSHPQTDHFGGLIDVVESYNVRSFVYNGFRGESEAWEELSAAVAQEEGIEVVAVSSGDSIKIGKIELSVLWPRSPRSTGFRPSSARRPRPEDNKVLGVTSPRDLNADSVVLWLKYGEFDALLTGDIGKEGEEGLLKKEPFWQNCKNGFCQKQVEVLKVPHHGSRYSSSEPFLRALKPALAVIQVGRNSYGHPTAEVLKRLEAVGARILRTDQDGEVIVRTDGQAWKVSVNPI